jgi:hypothetical protein
LNAVGLLIHIKIGVNQFRNNSWCQSSNGGDHGREQHAFLSELDQGENRRDGCRIGVARSESERGTGGSKAKADQLIADLKKRRDEFKATAKKQAEAGEVAWQSTKTQLESQWRGFESQVKTYFETVGRQIEQQQATFRDVAAAQVKSWREAADKLHEEQRKWQPQDAPMSMPPSSR